MRLFLTIIAVLAILAISAVSANSEFSVNQKPNFSVETHGNADYQTLNLSATYPLNFINGYIGAEWLHFQSEDNPKDSNYVRARLDGGYHFGRIGLRGYGRYGKSQIYSRESLLHGGAYVHIDVIENHFDLGVGTWLAQEELHIDYDIDASLETGPQLHAELRFSNISVLAEYLPDYGFENYKLRIIPIWKIPVGKFLFLNKIFLAISGEMEYDNDRLHEDIDLWQWQWKNAVNFEF